MSFVPVESQRPVHADPSGGEPAEESMLAIFGLLVALLGATFSCSIFVLRLASPPWLMDNLGIFVAINQFGVVIALLGAILSIVALFAPPRRLAFAGVAVGVIGGAAILFYKAPESPPVAADTTTPEVKPKPKPKPKPVEVDPQKALYDLPDTNEPVDTPREWTTMDGKKQTGKYLKTEQGKVLIQLADQTQASLEFKKLVPRDQRWVIKLNAPAVSTTTPKPADPLDVKRENYRNFATDDGQVFAAKYIRRTGPNVVFEYEDGTEFNFPMNRLSDADQAYVKSRK